MHFKYQLWDFPNQFRADFRPDFDGVLAINTFDDVSLKIVKENILRHFSKEKIIYKIANEIKKDWIQDEFETISMFKDSESFFIHQSDDFSRDFIDLIGNIKISSRLVILSFQKKQATWKKLHQDSKIVTLSIETPKFWESNKALDFICRYFSLQISYDAKSWMIEIFGNDLASFYNACFLLKINHPLPENLSLTHVQKHFVNERVDHFLMASLFSRKKMLDYYEKIILVQNDFEKLKSFFSFMQSHLLKVLDPSYLSLKPKLTNYDKDILSTHKIWTSQELISEISYFSHLEVLSKKKDSGLWVEIKTKHLQTKLGVNRTF